MRLEVEIHELVDGSSSSESIIRRFLAIRGAGKSALVWVDSVHLSA